MKLKSSVIPLTLLCLLLSSCSVNKSLSWFKKQDISKGLKPQPSYTIHTAEFEKQYHANKAAWDKAFTWMKTQDLESLAPGKYPIDGDEVFASITEMVDKPFEKTKWESHQKYIDLQYIIRGQEKIGMASSVNAKVTNPYNPAKDVANYEINNAKFYTATPAEFYLFFPSDAHRPNWKINEDKVKKLVIKIHVAE